MPYEAPEGRRVNAVGALAAHDPAGPRFLYQTRRRAEGGDDAAAHLAFVDRLAAASARPCVIVLDNYAAHHGRPVKAATPGLAERGVTFCFLPPYSPELNRIETVWRQVKYRDLPVRGHQTEAGLQAAVDAALAARERKLVQSTHDLPRST